LKGGSSSDRLNRISVSLKEREKAAAGDVEGLEKIGSEKEAFTLSLKSLDGEIAGILKGVSLALGGREVTVEAIRTVNKAAADELSSLMESAGSLVSRILDAEKVNQKLYGEKIAQIKDELSRLRQSRKMNYAYNRADDDLLGGPKFIDRKK